MDAEKTLSISDMARAAADLAVPLAAIRSVTEVESLGRGFYADGRPVILFERHVMYRRLKQALGARQADALAARHPDVVNPTSGGYRSGVVECDRLAKAAGIHRACALESASWGRFQIMGYHWKLIGFSSVQAFVTAMYRNEGEHLAAFVLFLKANPIMWDALKAKDWKRFAALYNGPGYAANAYDKKMAAAFERFDREGM
jgi:hypothetical protein